jgi:CRP/FNR family nitrogen fixation transcriptional regulator
VKGLEWRMKTEASLSDRRTIVRHAAEVDRAIPIALSETVDHASLASIGTFAPFHRHRRFCCEDEPAAYVYRIVDGLAEGYHLTSDGRRQILGFYAAGDLFGVEAGARYSMFVDALTEGRIQCITRSEIARLMSSNSPVLPELWSCLALGILRSQKHILRLGLPAAQRVAGFILEMCDRLSDRDECHLPMTRQEMADHLGLTIETISRTLTHLRQIGMIEFSGSRDVAILDRQRLKRLAC